MAFIKQQNDLEALLAAASAPKDPSESKLDDVGNWLAATGIRSGHTITAVGVLYKYYKEWSVAPFPKDTFSKSLKTQLPYEERGILIDDQSLEPARQQILKRIGEKRGKKKRRN